MLIVFNQVSVLFILLIVGFAIKKLRIIDDSLNKGLVNFLVYVALPSLAISSMCIEFSREILINCGVLLILSVIIIAFSIVFSIIIPRLFKIDGKAAGVFRFCTIFSNWGFMGFPVVNALYGKTGVFYAVIYGMPFPVLLWTLGVAIIGERCRERTDYKNLLNPGIVAAVIGLTIFLFSIKLPWPVLRSLELLAGTTTPLSMIVVGSILGNMDIKTVFKDIKVLGISIIRLVVLPLIVLLALKLMNFEHILMAIPIIITAMPAAANTVILAQKFNGDAELGSKIVFISTALSMITIPLVISLI